jgi:hypothetical protein
VLTRLAILVALAMLLGGWTHGISTFNGGLSQGQSAFLQSGRDDPFINELKSAQLWSYNITASPNHPAPDELDANGYPLYGAAAFTHGGVFTVYFGPSQAERPGNQVRYWNGTGTPQWHCIQKFNNVGGASCP